MSSPALRLIRSVTAIACFALSIGTSVAEEKPANSLRSNITPSSSVAFISNVDSSTLVGKVMVTYNGWYNIDGDRANRGWLHWTKNRHDPIEASNVGVELFPDLSEFQPDERFKTGIIKPDGRAVEVYSSLNKNTVKRHFQWMHDYRIDGAFIKRFALDLQHSRSTFHADTVLQNVRDATAVTGRTYAIMYELNGLGPHKIDMLIQDWQNLNEVRDITTDSTYLKHEGKPLVAIWGVGFDGRDYSLEDCRKLINFIKAQGCALMLGVPSDWRHTGENGTPDPALMDILAAADIINPGSIGRYHTPREARNHGYRVWRPEKEWCDIRGIDYLPIIFPGYSRGAHDKKDEDMVPREHGKLLWSQFQAAKTAGCDMVLVASFDGMHNGTAILKFDKTATNIPDINGIGFEDIPNDYYLKLAGDGGMLLKNAIARRTDTKKPALHYSSSD